MGQLPRLSQKNALLTYLNCQNWLLRNIALPTMLLKRKFSVPFPDLLPKRIQRTSTDRCLMQAPFSKYTVVYITTVNDYILLAWPRYETKPVSTCQFYFATIIHLPRRHILTLHWQYGWIQAKIRKNILIMFNNQQTVVIIRAKTEKSKPPTSQILRGGSLRPLSFRKVSCFQLITRKLLVRTT